MSFMDGPTTRPLPSSGYHAYDMWQILYVSKVFPKTSIWNWCPRPLNSGHGSADFKKFYHALQKSTEIYFQSFIYTQEYSISRKKELIMIPRCWNIWCIDQPWIQLIIRKLFPASFSFPFHSPILKPYFHLKLGSVWDWVGLNWTGEVSSRSDEVIWLGSYFQSLTFDSKNVLIWVKDTLVIPK